MSKVKDTKNKLKAKIEAIKKINDDPQGAVDSLYDKYFSNVPTSQELFGNKVDDFLEKRRTKIDNKTNIFEDIMDIADTILSSNSKRNKNKLEGESEVPSEPTKSKPKKRLRLHAETAAEITLENSIGIILDNVKKHFFASDGICGTDQTITTDSLNLKPLEFDFLNVLTVDPSSATGRIVYEPTASALGIKVNTELFSSFGGTIFDMRNTAGDSLFEMTWDVPNQEWNLAGLTTNVVDLKVEEFLNDYYSSIELPDIQHIIKTSMLMTIQSGESNPLFDKGLNNVNRLLKKLMSVCGSSTNRNNLSNQTAVDLVDENDQDLELYFNFDDVEGIDLDDEDNRYRKVLKFTDCNNFESPVNTTMLEDFVYLGYRKTTDDLVDSTINRAAGDFLPIILMYKILKSGANQTVDVLTSMKNLSKLFVAIVKDLFWFFLREFWKLIKVDLLAFVMLIVTKILKNKYKRYIVIITALIAILTQIVEEGIDNCFAIFTTILSAIQNSLSSNPPFSIPAILLGLSDKLPGYSQDRAYLNIVERMESAGISMGPIFGEENNLPKIIKAIIDGNSEEMDMNSFLKVTNKEMIIPSPAGPIIIPPGLLTSVGKLI